MASSSSAASYWNMDSETRLLQMCSHLLPGRVSNVEQAQTQEQVLVRMFHVPLQTTAELFLQVHNHVLCLMSRNYLSKQDLFVTCWDFGSAPLGTLECSKFETLNNIPILSPTLIVNSSRLSLLSPLELENYTTIPHIRAHSLLQYP